MHNLETVVVRCPYCGESVELVIDCSLETQSYIEDCEVCCRPIDISVTVGSDAELSVMVSQENEV